MEIKLNVIKVYCMEIKLNVIKVLVGLGCVSGKYDAEFE